MLLCVAGGGVTSFVKDMPVRGRNFSQQHLFATGDDTDIMDRVSLISSFNQDLQKQHVTYRSKVLLVQEDDSSSKTCIVSRSMFNSSTGSSAVVFNYRSRSGNSSFSASGCHVNHVQRLDTPPLHSSSSSALSTTSSSSSSTSSTAASSKKDGVTTSAWAQIMELEGYRSPAVGLDSHLVDTQTNDVSSGSEERDKSASDSCIRKRIYRKNTPASISCKFKTCSSQCTPTNSLNPNDISKTSSDCSFAQSKFAAASSDRCNSVYLLEKGKGAPAAGSRTTTSSSNSTENAVVRKTSFNRRPKAVSAKNACSKNSSPEHDPNASWGRYSCRAMRDSVRKVAEKYAQTTYTRRQNGGRIRLLSDGEATVTSTRTSSRLFKKQTEPLNVSSTKDCNIVGMTEMTDAAQPVTSGRRFSVDSFNSQVNGSDNPTNFETNNLAVTDWRKILCKKCSFALESEPLPHRHCSRRRSIDCPVLDCKTQDVANKKKLKGTSGKKPTCFVVTKEPSFSLVANAVASPCDGDSTRQQNELIAFTDDVKRQRSEECWKFTAEEMSQLVNGDPTYNTTYKRVTGATPNKWTNWIQKQKEKRKPVFFIGDDPACFTADPSVEFKGSGGPKRSVSLFEAKRNRNHKTGHNHDEKETGNLKKSENGRASLIPETLDSENDSSPPVQAAPAAFCSSHGKNTVARRSSSSCSGICGGSRKNLQASPIREEKGISQNDPSLQNGVTVSHGCASSLCRPNADDACRHIGFDDLNDPEAELQVGNADPSDDVTEMTAARGTVVADRNGGAHNHKAKNNIKGCTKQQQLLKFRRSSDKFRQNSREGNVGASDGYKQSADITDFRAGSHSKKAKPAQKGENIKKCQSVKDNKRGTLHGEPTSKKVTNGEKMKVKNNEKIKETKRKEKAKEIERDSSESIHEARDRSIVMGKLIRFGNITRTLSLHSLKRKQKQPKPVTEMNAKAEEKLSSNLRKCLSYAELGSGATPSHAFKKNSKYVVGNGVPNQVPGCLKCTCLSSFKRTVSLPSSFPLRHRNRRSHSGHHSKTSLGCHRSAQGRLITHGPNSNSRRRCCCCCTCDRDENCVNVEKELSPLVKKDTRSKHQTQNRQGFTTNKSSNRFALFEGSFTFGQSFLDVNEEISFIQNNSTMGLGSNHVLIGAADSYSQITMVEEHLFTDRTFSSSSDSSPTMSFVSEESTSPVPQFRHKKSSTLSRAERNTRRKSASEGTFRSVRKTLSNVLESQRPTSQFYADLDDQLFSDTPSDPNASNLFRLSSVSSGSQPILTATNQSYSNPNGTSSMLTGYPSLRTSTPHLSPVDSLVRKFRKSFALRFQKKKTNHSLSPAAEDLSNMPNSTPAGKLTGSENCGSNRSMTKKIQSPIAPPTLSPLKDRQRIPENSALGNFVLRPVRDRKNHKMKRDGRFSLFCDGFDNALIDNSTLNKSKCIRPHLAGSDLNILRKRAASTSDYSPKSKALQRPFSVVDYITLDSSSCTKGSENKEDLLSTTQDGGNGIDIAQKNGIDQVWRSNPVKLCRVHSRLMMCRHKGRYRLRRSISHPVELEMAGSINALGESTHCSTDQDSSQKGSLSSDDDVSSDSDMYHNYCCSPTRRSSTCWELSSEGIMYAEALWDHETLDSEELPFQTGDIIEVTDTSDTEWWWGTRGGRSGWFPASFVRMYICHRVPSMNFEEQAIDGEQTTYSPCKTINNNLTCDQIRANIVTEIVATERDYVKHLKDVVEGYVRQVRRRPDMFSNERIETVFGNIEQIYTFQSQFLSRLEECYQKDTPNLSQIGNCFLDHKEEFKMYSQYCNNHPLAVSELQELFSVPKYAQFFEACRLLREMIDISLDGFLLTPIQRICKYPLQLAELLKYTDSNHQDHVPVTKALAAMKEVAELVNERKRRMECLERIAEWQNSIEGWVGPDVLERSSILIHCGEVTRVSSTWSRDVYLFIFDHQLVYCKKDILKRNTYVYKGRLDLDCCDIIDVEDGRDLHFGVNVKNAWKIYYKDKEKWFLFYAKTAPEKDQWLCAFASERHTVEDDRKQGFVVTEDAKRAARLAVLNKQKPKRPRAKFSKGRRCHPDAAVTELLVLDLPSAKARSGSLPSNIHPELAIMTGAKLTPSRKKGSGWFNFGSGKKPKT